jgi:trehalose 6-phosphate synthase
MIRPVKGELIVVSNREPYAVRKGNVEKTVGGLVSALDPVMQAAKGVWIASGTALGSAGEGKAGQTRFIVPPGNPSYTMRLVPLTPRDMEGYYNGYSNRFLWPLCHLALDRVYLRKFYWQSYMKVNELFAGAVVAEAKGDAVVWLQDYHLSLCARYIRELRRKTRIAIFWHIPWPPYDVFRACPQRREILEGLLANNLIGFQLEHFAFNFIRCVGRELGAGTDLEKGTVEYRGHKTVVKSFPISVDFDWFEKAALEKKAERFLARFIRDKGLEGLKLGIAVGRLDYTKGIVKSLEAVEFFFVKYPRFKEKFTFIQVAVPTRKVEPYLSYMELVRKKIEAVNRKFSRGGWRPVEYIEHKLDHSELAALYRGADLALLSSTYDGMNLVAKEYAASQVDCKGALLVSEFAGAAEDIPGAVPINPYDTEGCADAIKTALDMKPERRSEAMERARWYIREKNIYRWVDDVLEELNRIR